MQARVHRVILLFHWKTAWSGVVQDLPLWCLKSGAQLERSTIYPQMAFPAWRSYWSAFTHVAQGSKRKCSHKQREAVESFRHLASLLPCTSGQSSPSSPTVKRQHTPHFNTEVPQNLQSCFKTATWGQPSSYETLCYLNQGRLTLTESILATIKTLYGSAKLNSSLHPRLPSQPRCQYRKEQNGNTELLLYCLGGDLQTMTLVTPAISLRVNVLPSAHTEGCQATWPLPTYSLTILTV